MTQLARLIDDHANLIEIADSLLSIVSGRKAKPDEAMSQLGLLSATLDAHLAIEDAMLVEAKRTGTKAFLPLAAQKREVFCQLVSDWVTYLRSWPAAKVYEDWNGFSRDTLDILRRLVMQIEVENEAVRMVATREQKGAARA